jgi:hypothetical protein
MSGPEDNVMRTRKPSDVQDDITRTLTHIVAVEEVLADLRSKFLKLQRELPEAEAEQRRVMEWLLRPKVRPSGLRGAPDDVR